MVTQRNCAVFGCYSSSKRNPCKTFFSLPLDLDERQRWLAAMNRQSSIMDDTPLDICEDHFNLEEDVENYVHFKYGDDRAQIKRGVVPHIFDLGGPPQVVPTSTGTTQFGRKRPRQPTLDDILIANKLLKESTELNSSDSSCLFKPFQVHVYYRSLEEEAAETLLLLSRDIRNG